MNGYEQHESNCRQLEISWQLHDEQQQQKQLRPLHPQLDNQLHKSQLIGAHEIFPTQEKGLHTLSIKPDKFTPQEQPDPLLDEIRSPQEQSDPWTDAEVLSTQ